MKKLTEKTLKMTSKKGFIELFWAEMSKKENEGKTQEEVYQILENEYIRTFGKRRYTSFKSFRRRRDE